MQRTASCGYFTLFRLQKCNFFTWNFWCIKFSKLWASLNWQKKTSKYFNKGRERFWSHETLKLLWNYTTIIRQPLKKIFFFLATGTLRNIRHSFPRVARTNLRINMDFDYYNRPRTATARGIKPESVVIIYVCRSFRALHIFRAVCDKAWKFCLATDSRASLTFKPRSNIYTWISMEFRETSPENEDDNCDVYLRIKIIFHGL